MKKEVEIEKEEMKEQEEDAIPALGRRTDSQSPPSTKSACLSPNDEPPSMMFNRLINIARVKVTNITYSAATL